MSDGQLTHSQVDELWDSMCQSAINLITKNLHMVENDELLLRIKGRVALFMLTMEVWLATESFGFAC
jgi:hypothetical protein